MKNREVRCNQYAERTKSNSKWAFNNMLEFLQLQKERVEKEGISSATIRNFVKHYPFFYIFYTTRRANA